MNFQQKLEKAIKKNNSLLCVGLDPDLDKIPQHLLKLNDPFFAFNKDVIDSTYDLVCAYKPQIAHYAACGIKGVRSLLKTIDYVLRKYPTIPIILDAKRADIGSTSQLYAKEAFDVFKADAVTVNPYFGLDSLQPFLERKDKGIIILCRTSNESASYFQDLEIASNNLPLYIHIAKKVKEWNETYENCLLVIGATWPEQLKEVRKIVPEMFFLVPGIGAQGGNLGKTLKAGLRKDKSGLIINSSRGIIQAENPRTAALELRNSINKYR